jgi:hypothetical protein
VGVLSRELFEHGDDAYEQAAMGLVEEGGAGRLPPIPQLAKDEALALMQHLADVKTFANYWDSLAEALGVSYRFTTAETWEDLDRDHARALIDEGLAQLHQQHLDTGVEDPIDPTDPEHRVHYSMLGLSGRHPAFERVREYIFSRAAYERLETLDQVHLKLGATAGAVKGRHEKRFMETQGTAWQIGRSLGVLDVLGEMPR